MKNLSTVLFLLLVLVGFGLTAQAAPPVFNGTLNVPQAGAIIVATPAPVAGANVYSEGDSITFGLGINNQSTNGCSYYTYPSPCYVDQMDSHWGATKANSATSGACLEATTTTGSLCSPAVTPALINTWQNTLLPYAGPNTNWFTIMIGANDFACMIAACDTAAGPDTQINVAQYKSDLETIVSGLENAGTPGSQIILGQVTWQNLITKQLPDTMQAVALLQAFNYAVAQVAVEYHTRLALTYETIASPGNCEQNSSQQNPCITDTVHPNNTGHALIAKAFEGATIMNAYIALASYNVGGMTNTIHVVTNPYLDTFQTKLLKITQSGSLMGSPGSYWGMNFASGFNANGSNLIGTNSATLNGVQGSCLYLGESTPSSVEDLTLDCATGNLANIGDIRASHAVVAGWIPGSTPTYSNGDLVAQESALCGKLILGGNGTNGNGTLDFGCTTGGQFNFNFPVAVTTGGVTMNIGSSGGFPALSTTTGGLVINSGAALLFNYGNSVNREIRMFDGGTTNFALLNYGTGLTWSDATTSTYSKTNATINGHIHQTATCKFACKVTLVSGTATWTFGTPFSTASVCSATPEGAPPSGTVGIGIAVSASSLVVTAYTSSGTTNTADTRVVDVICIGYPN